MDNKQTPQLGANGEPQALPVEDDLNIGSGGLFDPDEDMKRIQRETQINKVSPAPESNIGKETVGVGQPIAQPVNQGQSLPQSAIPVKQKFEGSGEEFYDPMDAERALNKQTHIQSGAQKTDF